MYARHAYDVKLQNDTKSADNCKNFISDY